MQILRRRLCFLRLSRGWILPVWEDCFLESHWKHAGLFKELPPSVCIFANRSATSVAPTPLNGWLLLGGGFFLGLLFVVEGEEEVGDSVGGAGLDDFAFQVLNLLLFGLQGEWVSEPIIENVGHCFYASGFAEVEWKFRVDFFFCHEVW